MKFNIIQLSILALGLILASCKKDDDAPSPTGTTNAVIIKGNTDTTQKYSGSFMKGDVNGVNFDFQDGKDFCYLSATNTSTKINDTKFVSSYSSLISYTNRSAHYFRLELDSVISSTQDDREALKAVFKVGEDTLNNIGAKLNLKYYRAGVVYSSHLSDFNIVKIEKVENLEGKVFYNQNGALPKTNAVRVTGKIDSALLTDFNSITGKTNKSITVNNIEFSVIFTTVNDESNY
ncbi:MAG: hypothetical protein RLZZ175_269 [Bacteroidota bacterium]|jgi:uncharacterized lipoprotein YbaY